MKINPSSLYSVTQVQKKKSVIILYKFITEIIIERRVTEVPQEGFKFMLLPPSDKWD
jgi:hypothetical protein